MAVPVPPSVLPIQDPGFGFPFPIVPGMFDPNSYVYWTAEEWVTNLAVFFHQAAAVGRKLFKPRFVREAEDASRRWIDNHDFATGLGNLRDNYTGSIGTIFPKPHSRADDTSYLPGTTLIGGLNIGSTVSVIGAGFLQQPNQFCIPNICETPNMNPNWFTRLLSFTSRNILPLTLLAVILDQIEFELNEVDPPE